MALDRITRLRAHARSIYTRFNKKYFSGELPKSSILITAPGKLNCNRWAETEWEDDSDKLVAVRIGEACWDIDANQAFLRGTICHEMMHVKLGPNVEHDSPEWKAEALRLSKLGAFVETV